MVPGTVVSAADLKLYFICAETERLAVVEDESAAFVEASMTVIDKKAGFIKNCFPVIYDPKTAIVSELRAVLHRVVTISKGLHGMALNPALELYEVSPKAKAVRAANARARERAANDRFMALLSAGALRGI
jgi:hypothetical protein